MCFYTFIWAYSQHNAKQLDALLFFMAISFLSSDRVISVSDQVSSMWDIISGLRFISMTGKKLK